MAKRSKPKLIPLHELRALCKEAGVELTRVVYALLIYENGVHIVTFHGDADWRPDTRRDAKAFLTGLIAMCKAGEL